MVASNACLNCAHHNPRGVHFCTACGAPLDALSADPGPPPPDLLPEMKRAEGAHAPAEDFAPSGGPKLLWWTIPADSLLQERPFRALMGMRAASETAINALGYGMLIEVVQETRSGFAAALVTVCTVAPAALFGLIGGAVVDRANKQLMLVIANAVRALICFAFLLTDQGVAAIFVLLVVTTVASQFATPAESAIVPRVVPPERLAGANSFANLCESAGQLLGMAILAPVFVKLTEGATPLVIACGVIFAYAALRAAAIGRRPEPEDSTRRDAAPRPWLAGTKESLHEAWIYLAHHQQSFIIVLLLVLASTANLVMVTLAPRFTQEVLDLSPEFAVFVFGPAVAGMICGLIFVPRIVHRVPPRVLVLAGFLLMVVALLVIGAVNPVTELLRRINLLGIYDPGPLGRGPLAHSNGRLGTVMLLAVPLGFSFSVVQVAANTYLNERVPLRMQGRVFALQGAIKNATAILPLLALGALASFVGVRPVLIVAPLLILVLALVGASRSAVLAGRPRLPVEGEEAAR